MATTPRPEVEPGQVLRTFSETEALALAKAWLHAYRPHGGPSVRHYLWHVFGATFPSYPALFGDEARIAYAQQEAMEYFVLHNNQREGFVTDQRPIHVDLADCVVFPPNLAWTMAFTHEDGWIGPIFARHRDWERLNATNLAQIRKRQAIEVARKNGWV